MNKLPLLKLTSHWLLLGLNLVLPESTKTATTGLTCLQLESDESVDQHNTLNCLKLGVLIVRLHSTDQACYGLQTKCCSLYWFIVFCFVFVLYVFFWHC